MSHFSVLVIGPNPDAQLAPYDENLAVEPRIDVCSWCAGEAKYQPCENCNDTGKAETTNNPRGLWDYWRIGGRWRGFLHLLPGRPGTFAEMAWEYKDGMAPQEDWTNRADQALRGDIDIAAMQQADWRTYAIVAEGAWKAKAEMGWFGCNRTEAIPDDEWNAWWDRLVDGLAPDTLLTVVDCHV